MPRTIQTYPTYPETDPVAVLFKLGWSREQFALAMGVERQTIDLWCAKLRQPGRQSRRLAAELDKLYA